MHFVWGPVRRIGYMYGICFGSWFIGVSVRYDPGDLILYKSIPKGEVHVKVVDGSNS